MRKTQSKISFNRLTYIEKYDNITSINQKRRLRYAKGNSL